MFLDSLNKINYKNNSRVTDAESDGLDIETVFAPTFPTIFVVILVILACYSVLNNNIFELYFYEGYGFLISVAMVFVGIISYLIICKLRLPKAMFYDFVFVLIVAVYIFISASITHSGYRYFGVVLNTMGTVIIFKHCKLSKNVVKLMLLLLIIAALICAYNVTGYYESQFNSDSVNSNYIAFFGVVVMVYGNVLITYTRKHETFLVQFVRLTLCIISFYIIWECQSRGSLLAWAFYVACVYFVPARVFLKKKNVVLIAALIAFFGVAFSYLYVTRINYMLPTFMGKSTATRYRLWSYFWNNIGVSDINLLFGFGTHSELRQVFGYGLHNIYIGIWYDIGIIGLILFMSFIVWNIKKAYECSDGNISIYQIYALIGFLSFMLSDYFAITFTGPLVIWNYAMLGLIYKKE